MRKLQLHNKLKKENPDLNRMDSYGEVFIVNGRYFCNEWTTGIVCIHHETNIQNCFPRRPHPTTQQTLPRVPREICQALNLRHATKFVIIDDLNPLLNETLHTFVQVFLEIIYTLNPSQN